MEEGTLLQINSLYEREHEQWKKEYTAYLNRIDWKFRSTLNDRFVLTNHLVGAEKSKVKQLLGHPDTTWTVPPEDEYWSYETTSPPGLESVWVPPHYASHFDIHFRHGVVFSAYLRPGGF